MKRFCKRWVKALLVLLLIGGGFYGGCLVYREFRPTFYGLYEPSGTGCDLSIDIGDRSELTIPHPRSLPAGFTIAREYTTSEWINSSRYGGQAIYGEFDSRETALAAVKSQMWTYAAQNWTIVLKRGDIMYFTGSARGWVKVWVWGGCDSIGGRHVGYIVAEEGTSEPYGLGQSDVCGDAKRCLYSIGFGNLRKDPVALFGIALGSKLDDYELLPEDKKKPSVGSRQINPPKCLEGFGMYSVYYTPITKTIFRIDVESRNPNAGASVRTDDMPSHDMDYYVELLRMKFGIKGDMTNVIGFNSGKQLALVREGGTWRKCIVISVVDVELYEQCLVESRKMDQERSHEESLQAQRDLEFL